jgi:hypothetical protein
LLRLEKESQATANRTVTLVVAQRANLDWRDIYGDLTLTVGQ